MNVQTAITELQTKHRELIQYRDECERKLSLFDYSFLPPMPVEIIQLTADLEFFDRVATTYQQIIELLSSIHSN